MQRIVLLAILLGAAGAQAGTIFEACVKDHQKAQRGCGAEDRYTGMNDPKEVDKLLGDIDKYGSFVKKSAACGRVPAHFENQGKMADAVAQLSDLKAGACHVTRTSCQATCGEVAIREDLAADVYAIVGASGKASASRQKAQTARGNDSECGGFKVNVEQFQGQAENARRNQQEALVGYNKSLQENVDWSSKNPECQAGNFATGGAASPRSALGGLPGASAGSRANENHYGTLGTLTQRPVGADPAAPGNAVAINNHGTITQANVAGDSGGGTANGGNSAGALPPPKVDAQSIANFRALAVPKGQFDPSRQGELNVIGQKVPANQRASGASTGGTLAGRTPASLATAAGMMDANFPDGITAANGLGIFEKITRQYRQQEHRLKH